MSYYHELYVVCDECHTSLLVDEATYEDADNDAADEGWQVVGGIEDKHYCPRHWHVKCHDCDAAGSGAPDELERQGWRIDRDYPCDSLCPECAKPPRRRTPARPILISTKTRVEWASPRKGRIHKQKGRSMATINQIPMTIMGNIVKDLEPKRTAGGKTVVAFRVAQTSVTERNGRWEDGETTFIRCVAYGPLADHMISSGIRKGTRVVVTGRFVQRDWQTETGEKRSSFELNADDIGTSVRYATVQITKANESAATPPAPQSQPTQPAQPTQEAKDDPWPNVVQDHFAEPQEPSF